MSTPIEAWEERGGVEGAAGINAGATGGKGRGQRAVCAEFGGGRILSEFTDAGEIEVGAALRLGRNL